jgi:ribosomal protein S18 acetylase RimI-like enzyme
MIRIDRLSGPPTREDLRDLAALLLDAIDDNAGVSFLALSHADAEAWWRSLLVNAAPRTVILVARDEQGIAGTVQLQPAWAPNSPHRADVAKLIVHRRARRRGIARALMTELEHQARRERFTLLMLDTRRGDHAERLYASMGWTRVGEVPHFARNPDGTMCTTVFFYKLLV